MKKIPNHFGWVFFFVLYCYVDNYISLQVGIL